jgi:FkbM family methyltransferase
MTERSKKKLIFQVLNFKVFFKYIFESVGVIRQGYLFRDKLTLSRHYLRTPIFLFNSLYHKKSIIEAEEEYKILRRDVRIKNRHGIFYCGNNILTVYAVGSSYEKHFDKYFTLEEGVFIDVGSHIGKYSIRLGNTLKDNGMVVALEPDKHSFKNLQTNVLLNKLDNVICLNKGAFSSKKELSFYVTSSPGEMYNSIYKQHEGSTIEKIEVDTIDNIAAELKLTRLDLIKIDTEGAEFDVIGGALKSIETYLPRIIIEVWSDESLSKIIETLSFFGYDRPVKIDEENYYFTHKLNFR